MIRRPPRSTQGVSSAASDVYKRQGVLLSCSAFGVWLGLADILTHTVLWLCWGHTGQSGYTDPIVGITNSALKLLPQRMVLAMVLAGVLCAVCVVAKRRITSRPFILISFIIPTLIFLAINVSDYGTGTAIQPSGRIKMMWFFSCVSTVAALLVGLSCLRRPSSSDPRIA